MAEKSEHQYLDEVLPGFSEARALIKANGDSVKAFGFLGDKLFDELRSQSLPQNQDQLDRFRSGDRRAVVFYAAAIRHIYVHGHLTAHPNGCTSESVEAICHAISDFLLSGIRDDFTRRLKLAKASVHA